MSRGISAIPSTKTCKFGVKVWVLAEAKTGYVLGFQIYTGAVLPAIPTEESISKVLHLELI